MKIKLKYLLFFLFVYKFTVCCYSQDIDTVVLNITVTKEKFKFFNSHPTELGDIRPTPSINKIVNDKQNKQIIIMGVVYLGLYPIENIDIYVCKKRMHFGRNTELWDSKFKIIKKIGKNNIQYFTLEGNNYLYSLKNTGKDIKVVFQEIEALENKYTIWNDTTGIYSISFKYDEFPVFWSPKLKKGTLLFIR